MPLTMLHNYQGHSRVEEKALGAAKREKKIVDMSYE